MSDTYTQPAVSFIHPDVVSKLESVRSLIDAEYAMASQSPDYQAGPWSPEKQAHVEAIADAITKIDSALRSLSRADSRAMIRMSAFVRLNPTNP